MANEYLKRTPTSSGNQKVWTLSAWIKTNDITGASGNGEFLFGYHNNTGSVPRGSIQLNESAVSGRCTIGWNPTGSSWYQTKPEGLYRDVGNWHNIVVSIDTTKEDEGNGARIYFNGVKKENEARIGTWGSGAASLNTDTGFNNNIDHFIGAFQDSLAGSNYQIFDLFWVDGQALTPDVFGFYKDGDGYQSSGTTKATDFRPGQWMPLSPSVIKKSIERRGGFGANGFYLPMNDNSNPGSDFHCAPNSIITLKGEDLPQPQNGAPTTSDAYVSQLRQETGTLGFDGAVKFDGDGDYLSLSTTSDFAFGTGDFTVEFWAWIESSQSSTLQPIFDNDYNSAGGIAIAIRHSDSKIFVGDNGSGFALCQFNAPFALNSWNHFAVVADGGTYKAFVNGVACSLATGSTTVVNTSKSSGTTEIGRLVGQTGIDAQCFISNLRVVKGTAVYTTNYTAPTEPLTNVTNTKLLCCNSSTSATAATVAPGTITANGDVFATRNELTGSMVLAVPGISTATGANLISNGTFDTNTTGWTVMDGGSTLSVDSLGRLQVDRSGSFLNAYQDITTEIGKRYTVSGNLTSGTGASAILRAYKQDRSTSYTSLAGSNGDKISFSFTALETTSSIIVAVDNNGGNAFFDNIEVKQEDAPRDYSADIKDSGTNKTVTPVGNAGVGYELGNYYGSAMTFDGNGDEFTIPANVTDLQLGGGDFTIESWIYPRVYNSGNMDWIGKNGGSAATSEFEYGVFSDGRVAFYHSNGSTYSNTGVYGLILPAGSAPVGQWTHIVGERHGNIFTAYINGVAAGVILNFLSGGSMPSGTADLCIGSDSVTTGTNWHWDGRIQDLRIYKGLAKYKGGFDVPKPYTPVGIEAFRTTDDTCKNNFATYNPLVGAGIAANDNAAVLKDGNLYYDNANQSWATSTIGVSSGKYYAEFMVTGGILGSNLGVCGDNRHGRNNQQYHAARGISYIRLHSTSVTKDYNATSVTETAGDAPLSYESGSIVGITIDYDNKEIKYYKNGTLIRTDSTPASYTPVDFAFYFLAFRTNDGASPVGSNWSDVIANFGQNPSFSGTTTAGTNADGNGKGLFKYAPPSGFLALCEDNLSTPAVADPGKHFKCVLYSGDNTAGRRISDVGFQPDLVWVKARNATPSHIVTDSVRGIGHQLSPDDAGVEVDSGTFYLNGFADNGFDLGDGANSGGNTTGRNYVAWCWKAGGAAVTNNDGSRTTQVSANQTAGFSIGTFTGDIANTHTIGHGLGKVPSMIIVKERTGNSGWAVYHRSRGNTKVSYLNATDSEYTESGDGSSWNATDPTSTVFSVGKNGATNDNTLVFYAWAEIEGYSKFGSYAGNGSTDGPFVYCGFKPAFILVKNVDTTGHWVLWDSSRTPNNDAGNAMRPDGNFTETSGFVINFLSNGFKLRDGETSLNKSGDTHIFVAFAESPFQTANAK